MPRLQNHTGTIFHAKSESGYYVFGTVLLDIEFLIRKRALPYGTPIDMPNSVLVEMYDYVDIQPRLRDGAVAIPGAFVDRDSLGDAWGVCGRKTITPRDISFPQGLIGYMHDRGECAFLWGEIQIPIPIKASWLYSNKTYLSRHSTGWWPETVLGTLGHLEKVPEGFRHAANLSSNRSHPGEE